MVPMIICFSLSFSPGQERKDMNKKRLSSLFLSAILGLMLGIASTIEKANACSDNDTSGPSHGHGRDKICLQAKQTLSFGEFVFERNGKITVDAHTGICKPSSGASMIHTSTCARGELLLRGHEGEQVKLNFPPQVFLTGSGGHNLSLSDFKTDTDDIVVIGKSGYVSIGYGGTLSGNEKVNAGGYNSDFIIETEIIK